MKERYTHQECINRWITNITNQGLNTKGIIDKENKGA